MVMPFSTTSVVSTAVSVSPRWHSMCRSVRGLAHARSWPARRVQPPAAGQARPFSPRCCASTRPRCPRIRRASCDGFEQTGQIECYLHCGTFSLTTTRLVCSCSVRVRRRRPAWPARPLRQHPQWTAAASSHPRREGPGLRPTPSHPLEPPQPHHRPLRRNRRPPSGRHVATTAETQPPANHSKPTTAP